jgi:hypothetical protein
LKYKSKEEIIPITSFLDEMLENKVFSLVILIIKITNLAVSFYCCSMESRIIEN